MNCECNVWDELSHVQHLTAWTVIIACKSCKQFKLFSSLFRKIARKKLVYWIFFQKENLHSRNHGSFYWAVKSVICSCEKNPRTLCKILGYIIWFLQPHNSVQRFYKSVAKNFSLSGKLSTFKLLTWKRYNIKTTWKLEWQINNLVTTNNISKNNKEKRLKISNVKLTYEEHGDNRDSADGDVYQRWQLQQYWKPRLPQRSLR